MGEFSMTTMTYTYTREPGLPKVGLVLLMALIMAMAVSLFGALPQIAAPTASAAMKPIPPVVYERHAFKRHDADALAVRQCLNDKGGADEIWRSFSKDRFYLICGLPDDRWGFQIIQKDLSGRWHEVTAFIRENPTLSALRDYLRGFGSKFNGPYP